MTTRVNEHRCGSARDAARVRLELRAAAVVICPDCSAAMLRRDHQNLGPAPRRARVGRGGLEVRDSYP